jgi:hypothetical protein
MQPTIPTAVPLQPMPPAGPGGGGPVVTMPCFQCGQVYPTPCIQVRGGVREHRVG